MESSLLDMILYKAWRIQEELELYGIDNVLLNDIASIAYGVPRLFFETRILVEKDSDNRLVGEALATVLGMKNYLGDIINRLDKEGRVALNPLVTPVVYIVKASSRIEYACLENTRSIDVSGYRIKIPCLEEYIAYLYTLDNLYPYIVDAITLHIIHHEILDHSKLREYGVTTERLCSIVDEIRDLTNIFYEVNSIVEAIREKYCSSKE